MEKIFDSDFREELIANLIAAGITEKKALKIVDDSYTKKLIVAAASRLRSVADALEQKDFNVVKHYLRFSPAGDCMGLDNTYIGFDDICGNEVADIGDVYYKLTGKYPYEDDCDDDYDDN